jgi:hypothetical protein
VRRLLRQGRDFYRFARSYREFLRDPVTTEEARSTVVRRMETRGLRFLEMVERSIFAVPKSPYHTLMRLAGCTMADLERLVHSEGLDGALLTLRREGVYFTFEEYKGRQPVVRQGQEIPVRPVDFNNSSVTSFYEGESGGSTGRPTRVYIDVQHVAGHSHAFMLAQKMWGLLDQPMGMWLGVLPDPTGTNNVVRQAKWGRPPRKWFSQAETGGTLWRHHVFTRSIVALSRAYGVEVPRAEPLGLDNPLPATRWIASTLELGGGCTFFTQPSKALRIALAAQEANLSLEGATFIVGGEPITAAKARSIHGSGARYVPLYAFSEHGVVGEGCPASGHDDEVHVFDDSLALIPYPRTVPNTDVMVDSLHFTSLLPPAPKILLNVESDDYAIIEKHPCTCALGELGFHTRLRHIRSFSKLTGEGTTLVGSDVARVLEEELPERFGGSALDYQLVEEEDDQGLTHLSLYVDPGVPLLDEAEVARHLLSAVEEGTAVLIEAGSVRVKRISPVPTSRGKHLPLRLLGRPAAAWPGPSE